MSSRIRNVEQALMALNQNERAAVIQRGIDSLEAIEKVAGSQSEIDSAWTAEAFLRVDQVENHTVELLDLKDSHRQLRAELAARRHTP